jgi:hypothetical protein
MASEMKSKIGERSGYFEEAVTGTWIASFRAAIHASSGREASPTFLTTCRKGEFELLQRLGVTLSRVLHAEQEYSYASVIIPGDSIGYETTLADVFEKKGASGQMVFLTFETTVAVRRGGDTLPGGTSRTVIVIR